jgi:hypothetical protein
MFAWPTNTFHPNCIIRIRYCLAWFVGWRYDRFSPSENGERCLCIMIWQIGLNNTVPNSWFSSFPPSSALLRVLLVRIRSHLRSFLRYKFLILGTYHPDYIYVSKNVRIRCYLSEPKGVHDQNNLGNTDLRNLWRFSVLLGVPGFVLCALYLFTMSVFVSLCRCIYACANWQTIGQLNTHNTTDFFIFHFRVQGKKLLFDPEVRGSIFLRRYLCTTVYVSTSQKKCARMIIRRINSGRSRQVAWRKTWNCFFQNEIVGVDYQGVRGHVMKVSQFLTFVVVIVFFGRRQQF